MTARQAAVEVLRAAVEELQPPGAEMVTRPEWLAVALVSPENARAIDEEVRALTNEARRISCAIVRASASPPSEPPQLTLFRGAP